MLLMEGKYGTDIDGIYRKEKFLKLYGESKLQQYADDLMKRFSGKANYVNSSFDLDGPFSIDVYLFLDEEKFNKFIDEQGDNITFEKYKKAAYGRDKIAILADGEKLVNKPFHYANVFAHAYVHLIFLYLNINRDGILWYEEGLAQLLSGERGLLEDEELFKQTLLKKVFNEKWKIPMIENLWIHGNEVDNFDSNDYNGYTISYMLVRYLRDQELKGKFYKKALYPISNLSLKVKEIGKDIINRVYNYYGVMLNMPGYDLSLSNIRKPHDLCDYMNLYITYGWIDINGGCHEHSLDGIRDIYRINSLEQLFKSGLGTCIEQAMLEHFVFENLGIENKILVNREFESGNEVTGKVRLHCFCAYRVDDYWYIFEQENRNRKIIHRFNSFVDLCNYQYRRMDVNRFLTEIPDIPVGYTLGEFNKYVNTFLMLGRGKKL